MPAITSLTSTVNSLMKPHRWSPCIWGSKPSPSNAMSNTWGQPRHQFSGETVRVQLGDSVTTDNQGPGGPIFSLQPWGACPLPYHSTPPMGRTVQAGITSEGRDQTTGPLIYGHWCNSFKVIYLTAEERANSWRSMIGRAGFVHFWLALINFEQSGEQPLDWDREVNLATASM